MTLISMGKSTRNLFFTTNNIRDKESKGSLTALAAVKPGIHAYRWI